MIFLTQEIQVGVTLQIVPLTVFHYDGTVFLLPTVAWFPDSPLIKHQFSFGVIPYKLALLCLISSTDPPRSQVCKEKYNDTIDFQSSSHLNVIGSELRNKTFTILKLLELHVCVYTIYTCRYKFHAFFFYFKLLQVNTIYLNYFIQKYSRINQYCVIYHSV